MQIDIDLSKIIYDTVGPARLEALTAFGGAGALPLNWGEIVPLSFLVPNVSTHAGGAGAFPGKIRVGNEGVRLVVLSVPTSRYNHSVQMIGNLLIITIIS